MDFKEQNIEANGISIRYRIEGRKGAPWIVFSNSLMTNLTVWDDQVNVLKDRFQILRYDQRGHGRTTIDARPCDFELLVDDVIALLDSVGVERMTFIGVSMGSGTALRIAQRYPQRIERIVMCAGSAASSGRAYQDRIDLARANGMQALVEPTIARWYHPDSLATNGPSLQRVREMIRTTPFEGFVACAQALMKFDFQAGVSAMRLPVLMLAGEADQNAMSAHTALQPRIAGSRRHVIPKAGHLANIEAPAAVNALVINFLNDTSA